jgi:hypothetical protein
LSERNGDPASLDFCDFKKSNFMKGYLLGLKSYIIYDV